MKHNRRWTTFAAFVAAMFVLGALFVWHMGSQLMASANHPVGAAPADLRVENVEFPSDSGTTIHGWFVAGEPGKGAVVLMHGVHSDRRSMVARAKFLSHAGYAVLLFDFQAHGGSPGQRITFGYLESRDATAAVEFLRHKLPGEKIGVIGGSMGAAAALLAHPPLPVEAMVLESCYPTIYQATEDRMAVRFGSLGKLVTPLLTCQLKPRLGIGLADLAPLECAKQISVPKFFLAGTADQNTTIEEARALFAAAQPKQSWWLEGAGHVDQHTFAGDEYEKRVLAFLAIHLH